MKKEIMVESYASIEVNDKKLKLYNKVKQLANIANKRIQRLEKNNLQNSPAYQSLQVENGIAERFKVNKKFDYNQLQSQYFKLQKFVNYETSTIRGYNRVIKNIASKSNIKYKNLTDLKQKLGYIFSNFSQLEQYFNSAGLAIPKYEIWREVSKQVEKTRKTIGNNLSNEQILSQTIDSLIKESQAYEKEHTLILNVDGKTEFIE